MLTVPVKHLRAGSITAQERRYLVLVCGVKYFNLLAVAVVTDA